MVFVFDVEGVITYSKANIDNEMVECLRKLLNNYNVAFITGSKFDQLKERVITYLNDHKLEKLLLLPLSGSEMWSYEKIGRWKLIYNNNFSFEEKHKIVEALMKVTKKYKPGRCFFSQVINQEETWGAQIEDRGCQITWSAFGQKTPYEIKKLFDIDYKKRTTIKNELEKIIPEFEVRIGGCSSIDVIKKGIDKAYGIDKLIELFYVEKEDIVFIGDYLFEGGNDYPVKKMGVECIKVDNPEETKELIEAILKNKKD